MTADKASRPRRAAGHRPSALSSTGRPRKVADSRRVAGRSAAGAAAPGAAPGTPATGVAVDSPGGADSDLVAPAPAKTARAEGADDAARFRVTRLSVVLLGVAALLAVGVALLGWDLTRMSARADARQAAQVVAAESMETILSYDHAHYDKGVAAARTLMTGDFAKKYADTVATVRPRVLETESVVKAEVVASSVVSAEPDQVKALLFVNQTTSGKQVQQPRVDLNRVVVTLVRDDGGAWLVSDVDAL